jgi:hypothetical protein
VVGAGSLWAADYYVDPQSGTNSTGVSGSSGSPWQTLEWVLDNKTFSGGDVIYLRNGYHGAPEITGSHSSSNPVTIQAQLGHSPDLQELTFTGASGWVVSGLNISPTLGGTTFGAPSPIVFLDSSTSDVVLKNCYIYNLATTEGYTGSTIDDDTGRGILCDAQDSLFESNHIVNTRWAITIDTASATGNVLRGNWIEDTVEDGIRVAADNTTVEYNTIINFHGIQVGSNHDDGIQGWESESGLGDLSNCVFRGNVVIDHTTDDRLHPQDYGVQGMGFFDGWFENCVFENNLVVVDMWHGITLLGAKNCEVINNTVMKNPLELETKTPFIWIGDLKANLGGYASSGNLVFNNLMMSDNGFEGTTTGSNTPYLSTSDYGTYFVDADAFDFRLDSSNAAVDSANTTYDPRPDLRRFVRSDPDRGAYEYFSGSAFREFQGEDFTLASDATKSDSSSGYVGDGYVDFGGNGSSAEWHHVIASSDGAKWVTFRYANGSGSDRTCDIYVNGVDVGDLDFSSTGSWNTWATETPSLTLKKGFNEIRVVAKTSAGGPNLDFLGFTDGSDDTIDLDFSSTTDEDEFVTITGGDFSVSGGVYDLTGAGTAGLGLLGNIAIHRNYRVSSTNVWTASAKVRLDSTGSAYDDAAFIFGYIDAENYYYVSLNESNDSYTCGLFQVKAGSPTELANFSTFTAGVTYTIEVERDGESIIVRRNGSQIASVNDFTFGGGRFGFGSKNDGAQFDDLSVE